MRNYFDAILSAVDDAKMELEDCESTISYLKSEIARKDKAYKLLDKKCDGLMNDNHELIEREREQKEKIVRRTSQLLLLVDKYAEVVPCEQCPITDECPVECKMDRDPIACGAFITEWLEKATKEDGE